MYYYKPKKRALISLEGRDVNIFLQAIISNDINKITKNRSIYSTLLSPQGKFLHDFFIFKFKNKIYLDTSKQFHKKLTEKIELYKLNRKIKICSEKFYSYFLLFGGKTTNIFNLEKKEGSYKQLDSMIIFNDPRKINLGCRVICKNKNDENKVVKFIKEKNIKNNYDKYEELRISNCIPDIEKDNLYNNAYLLQYNFEKLNAICWKKGCFIGQEVTVRMKNKGLGKKKLFPIKNILKNLHPKDEIKHNNQIIGHVTSSKKKIGLALLDISAAKKMKKQKKFLVI